MFWDNIIVGGGHNGLAAAAYLARGGQKTLVLERRSVLGGACVTEEIWPGYKVSRAAYVAGLLRPALIDELGLRSRGLEFLARSPSSFTPLPDGRSLTLGLPAQETHEQIAAFSKRDADAFPRYEAFLDKTARTLEPMLDAAPPQLPRLRLSDLRPLARALAGAWGLGSQLPSAIALLLGPARPVLESWFDSEPLKATLATDAVIGAWASPASPGTGYVLFHHVMGETGGARGVWAYVRGGMGALSEALASAARDSGAEIRTDCPVERIAVQAGRAVGVVMENGDHLEAKRVVSCADPRVTFSQLMAREDLPEDFAREIDTLDYRSGSVKINLALDRLPVFRGHQSGTGTDSAGPEHRGTIHVGALDLDSIEAAFESASAGILPQRPMVELTIPSAVDDTLAPPDRYVASMFVQYAPWDPAGGGWDVLRDRFADTVFAMVDEVAPGFSSSVVHREVLAPPDLERVFALSGGNIFHGAMSLDRLFFMRPLPRWSRYQTPIDGLWLCGAGTHPGGGVMGACGRNAAREILRSA